MLVAPAAAARGRGGGVAFNNRRGPGIATALAARNHAAIAAASNAETIQYDQGAMARRPRNNDPIDQLDYSNQSMTIGLRSLSGLVSTIREERVQARHDKEASNINTQVMNLLQTRALLSAQGLPTQVYDNLLTTLQNRQMQLLQNLVGDGGMGAGAAGVAGAVGVAEAGDVGVGAVIGAAGGAGAGVAGTGDQGDQA